MLTTVPGGAPVLESEGVKDGAFQWVMKLPLILTYQSGVQKRNQDLTLRVVVVRSGEERHPFGVAIKQWIATSR